jgi:uncharacterized membrane protein YfcA
VIVLAGFWAGAINAVVGSGTLITFPTLVALGHPPVTATMSNAVGLVAGSVSGTWGYRRELSGQWSRLRWQIPASLVGAGLGAWLLLHLPEKVFAAVVPVLLIAALVMVAAGPWIQARRTAEEAGRPADHVSPLQMAALVACTFAIGVYGGYFTAAQGILLVAAMGALLPESVQRMNAAKNLHAPREHRCGAGLHVRSDQLAGGRSHRGGFPDRLLAGRTLRPSAVAECSARHDGDRRPHRPLPAVDRVTGARGAAVLVAVSPVGRHSNRRTC